MKKFLFLHLVFVCNRILVFF